MKRVNLLFSRFFVCTEDMEKIPKKNMGIRLIIRARYGKIKQLNNYRCDKC
jgi:hypothetical protein